MRTCGDTTGMNFLEDIEKREHSRAVQISVERMGKTQGAPEGQLDLPEVGAAYLCEQRGQCERDKKRPSRALRTGEA